MLRSHYRGRIVLYAWEHVYRLPASTDDARDGGSAVLLFRAFCDRLQPAPARSQRFDRAVDAEGVRSAAHFVGIGRPDRYHRSLDGGAVAR